MPNKNIEVSEVGSLKVLSPVLLRDSKQGLGYFCPGCICLHFVPLKGESTKSETWLWNGNVSHPTLLPSVNVKTGHFTNRAPQPPNCEECNEAEKENTDSLCSVCHSSVIAGVITFFSDCTHSLAGESVKIPEIPEHLLNFKSS